MFKEFFGYERLFTDSNYLLIANFALIAFLFNIDDPVPMQVQNEMAYEVILLLDQFFRLSCIFLFDCITKICDKQGC